MLLISTDFRYFSFPTDCFDYNKDKDRAETLIKNFMPTPFPSKPIVFLYKTLTNDHRHSLLCPFVSVACTTSILASTCYPAPPSVYLDILPIALW